MNKNFIYMELSELRPEEHFINVHFSSQQHNYADHGPVTDTLSCQVQKKIPGEN